MPVRRAGELDVEELRRPSAPVRGAHRSRQALFARACDVLTRSLDYDTTLRNIGQLAIPQLADWTGVYAPGDGEALAPRLVLSHRSPRKEALLGDTCRQRPFALPDSHPLVRSLRNGAPVLFAGDSAEALEALLGGAAGQLEVIRRVGLRRLVAVPLIAHDVVLGSLMLVKSRQSRSEPSEEQLLQVALELAGCCAQAIHNARLYRATKLAIRMRDENTVSSTYQLLELLADVREHSDGLREHTSTAGALRRSRMRRGLAQIELLVLEMEHLIRELHAIADVQAPPA